jgi:hypothetical protein
VTTKLVHHILALQLENVDNLSYDLLGGQGPVQLLRLGAANWLSIETSSTPLECLRVEQAMSWRWCCKPVVRAGIGDVQGSQGSGYAGQATLDSGMIVRPHVKSPAQGFSVFSIGGLHS